MARTFDARDEGETFPFRLALHGSDGGPRAADRTRVRALRFAYVAEDEPLRHVCCDQPEGQLQRLRAFAARKGHQNDGWALADKIASARCRGHREPDAPLS